MKHRLKEIFQVFLKLGFFAFGGPAAHVSMMDDEIVEKRKWLSRQHFLDLMGATNLIPGPNSTQMTMHCGMVYGKVPGLFIAGVSFIFPAFLITLALSWFYMEYQTLPQAEPIMQGIQAAVIALIFGAVVKLGKKAIKNLWLLLLALIIGFMSIMAWYSEPILILLCLPVGLLWGLEPKDEKLTKSGFVFLGLGAFSQTKLFLSFLKVALILYGSGYVLIAYLDAELVNNLGWLTQQELLDAVAVGQMTPGPVLTTATFIGFQLGGLQGAVLATIGIFIPSFLLVWWLNPYIPKWRKNPILSSMLNAVNAGAVAVMAAVAIKLSKAVIIDWKLCAITVISFILFYTLKKFKSIAIVVLGGLLGYLSSLI